MSKWIKIFFLVQFTFISLGHSFTGLEKLPIQENGRVKPFQTFANKTLQLIHGKQKFEGKLASEIVFTWLLQPNAWQDKKLFEVKYLELKKSLKLNEKENRFSINEILSSDRLTLVFQELQAKRETKEKLDPFYQAIQKLENQIGMFREVVVVVLLVFSNDILFLSLLCLLCWSCRCRVLFAMVAVVVVADVLFVCYLCCCCCWCCHCC